MAVSCTDGHVRVVDPDTVKVTHDLAALEGWAYSLAVHPTDGSILVGGQSGQSGQSGQLRRVMIR